MAFIHPFEGHVVAPEWAGAVVAPAYDSLTPEERRQYADRHPENYLNAMRAADEYASADAPALSAILKRNARFVRRYVEAGRFVAQPPCVIVYRLASDGHVQRGVVAEMSIGAYLDGRIRRHEFTGSRGKMRSPGTSTTSAPHRAPWPSHIAPTRAFGNGSTPRRGPNPRYR